jgi:putative radical SAM enzyme (TIGR03279 family)
MLVVKSVEKNSIGEELGFEKGDAITCFDGYKVQDILDYIYYDSQSSFELTVKTTNGEICKIDVEKEDYETLGLTFESDLLDIKTCQNKCVFCFVDQMPKGMRKTLYVKDDDYRQSFMVGNFVTLTNLKQSDLERIVRLKLSPLYVSVQVVNPEVRIKMLNNRFAGDIYEKLKYLTQNGIQIEGQIVLVPSLNDGLFLEDSIRKLYELRPNFKAVSVVPCGITKFRQGLYPIRDIDKNYSKCVIEQVKMLNGEFNEPFVTLGDEFYFKAGLDVESVDHYGDFSQLGNGVGTTAKFESEIDTALTKRQDNHTYLVISGESASSFIEKQCQKINKYCKNATYYVLGVKNNFFGDTVNCTGLLTGQDIVEQVSKFDKEFDILVISDICLRQFEDVFLDDMTLTEFAKKINKKIYVTDGSGENFFNALTGGVDVRKI